jgi:outer membrane protein OmpA-like peptidoglycan-associated protein/tetratricopeptide (TPR) repeat protein
MKYYSIYLFIFFFGCYSEVFSQQYKLEKAGNKYDNFAYVDAINVYEKIANKGFVSEEILKKLGNAYFFQGNYSGAIKWYDSLFKLTKELEIEYYFRYSHSLKAIGEYDKAKAIMQEMLEKSAEDKKIVRQNLAQDYLEVIQKHSGRYSLDPVSFNSEFYDFCPSFFGDKIVFTSSRGTSRLFEKKHKWTNQYFTNLYEYSEKEKVKPLFGSVNSKYNESSAVFTKDRKMMYFTRNNYITKSLKTNSENTVLLKIYSAKFIDGKWGNIQELPFNNDSFNCAHPALSFDEKTLYFVSDMPGSFGASDLYKVAIKGNNTFGKPQNLGKEINTEGRETFPFVASEKEFYFASDGIAGLGGLDVYVSKIIDKGYSKPINLGTPINSNADDFGFIINTSTKKGFFSSNRRENNLGYDDIYQFTEKESLKECTTSIKGVIQDAITKETIACNVVLFNEKHEIIASYLTTNNGDYEFNEIPCSNYFVRVSKNEYCDNEVFIGSERISDENYTIAITPKKIKLKIGDDLKLALGIETIYFDLDKWDIRKDAAIELAKIETVLKENPSMRISIRSHTDSRQSNKYNQELSQKRAISTKKWLIASGIADTRLEAQGFGESQLVNSCADGIDCPDEAHQANRRSEFIILEN